MNFPKQEGNKRQDESAEMTHRDEQKVIDNILSGLRERARLEQIRNPQLVVHERMYAHLKDSGYFDESVVPGTSTQCLKPNDNFPKKTMRYIKGIIGYHFLGKPDLKIVKSEKIEEL